MTTDLVMKRDFTRVICKEAGDKVVTGGEEVLALGWISLKVVV